MCGENQHLCLLLPEKLGSPPRVRGKRSGQYSMGYCCRITPACAGKTEYDDREGEVIEDHPRVCGENAPVAPSMLDFMGSPPRVRGKL